MTERFSDAQPENIGDVLPEAAEAEIQAEKHGEADPAAMWYVVHTYSGYENKVKDTLEKSIKSSGMENYIFEVRVPVEEVTEIKKGKRVKATRKVFPGYVIVKMIKTNQSWYVVRNTRGVTGFVGPDGQPVALTDSEVEMMLNPQEGQFTGQKGEIVEIDKMLGKVLVRLHPFANRTTEQWFNMEDVIIAEEE